MAECRGGAFGGRGLVRTDDDPDYLSRASVCPVVRFVAEADEVFI